MKKETKEILTGYGIIAIGAVTTLVGWAFTQRTDEEVELERRTKKQEKVFESQMQTVKDMQGSVLRSVAEAEAQARASKDTLKEMRTMTESMTEDELSLLKDLAKGSKHVKTMDYLAEEISGARREAKETRSEMIREINKTREDVSSVKRKVRDLESPDYIFVRR